MGILTPCIEEFILKNYMNGDADARKFMELAFHNAGKSYLLHPNVSMNDKALIRVFSLVPMQLQRVLYQDFEDYDLLFTSVWSSKENFIKGL